MTHSLCVPWGFLYKQKNVTHPPECITVFCGHMDTNLLRPSLHNVKQNPGQMQLLMCEAETFQNRLRAADDRICLESQAGEFWGRQVGELFYTIVSKGWTA